MVLKCEFPECTAEHSNETPIELLWGTHALCSKHYKKVEEKGAKELTKDKKKEIVKKRNQKNLAEGNILLLWAENYVQAIPTYYDKSGMWWKWNFEKNKYEITDETDILNSMRWSNENIKQQTVTQKSQLVEALKQCARETQPTEISKEWVQFGQNLYNIETGEEKKATPNHFVTNPIPWSVGESEETPMIDSLFKSWVGEEYVQTMHEIISFCTLIDYPLHRFFVLTGQGLNGKGCFLNILEKFIGEENTTNIDLDALTDGSNRFEKANLYKKLLCTVGETNYALIKKTGVLKSVTGGDLITFEFKNKNPFQARNYAKIIMATNSLPPTTDRTTGFYRRTLIIDFPNRFTENPHLLDSIPEQEYHNLARKSLRTVKELLAKRAFHNEGSIEQRAQKYEDVSNPLQRFLKEKTKKDPEGHIFKFEFKDKFISWQTQNGYRVWSEKQISQMMKEQFEEQRINSENGDKRWYAWLGIGWYSPSVKDVKGCHPFSLSSYTRESKWKTVSILDKLDTAPVVPEFEISQELLKLLRDSSDSVNISALRTRAPKDFPFKRWMEKELEKGNIYKVGNDRIKILE